jgi:MFS family permease
MDESDTAPLPRQVVGVRARPLEILHNRSFLALWLGLLVSSVGDWVNYVAMVSLVWGETHSTLALAALRLFHIVPILLIAPLSGVLVDRWSLKATLVASPLIAGLVVGVLIFFHPLWAVFLAYGGVTISLTFFNPAQACTIPLIVPDRDLVPANSLSQITSTTSIVLGGLAGGLVVSQLGAPAAFLADAVSFVAIAAFVTTISLPRARPVGGTTGVRDELVEGVAYLRGAPFVRLIVIAGVVFVFAPATVLTLGYAFVGTSLHGGAAGYGRVLAGYGIGQALAVLVLLAARRRLREDVTFVAGGVILGVGDTVLGLTHGVLPAAIAYGASGFGSMANGVAAVTLLQRLVPERIRGRIFAVSSTFDHAGAFASTLLVGVGGGAMSPGALISLAGAGAAAMGLCSIPLLQRRRRQRLLYRYPTLVHNQADGAAASGRNIGECW